MNGFRKQTRVGGWALLCTLAATTTAMAQPEQQPGRVSQVTLYRGQALVTRTITLEGNVGQREIVVPELPEQIVADSLFAEGEGVDVRAVRYRTKAVGQEPREEVRALDAQIKTAQMKVARNQQMAQMLEKRKAYLDNLEKFAADKGKQDLDKGTLDADALQKLTVFMFEQRSTLLDEELKVATESAAAQEELELLQRKRSEMTNGSSKTMREAVVFLNKRDPGNAVIRLNYLVDGAGWSPAYNLRATQQAEGLELEYHALITQLTGENWDNVKLTLSTASPSLSSATPGLAPFRVSLSNQGQGKGGQGPAPQTQGMLVERYNTLNNSLLEAQRGQGNAFSLQGNFDYNWKMNDASNGIQLLELTTANDRFRNLRLEEMTNLQAPSITYDIENAVSLESRSDQQMVRIMDLKLPSEFYHVATPMLSGYVFREAQIQNTSQNDLLAGPITVYLNGRFVGRTEIPTVARGQNFVVGLGADSQLRTRRELVEKTDDVQGGNREVKFQYRLVLENYKDAAAQIRVYDRMPVPNANNDIEVKIGESSDELSKDRLYVRLEKPKGILRWDLKVDANSSGEKARLIDYNYTLEFDRNFNLSVHTKPSDLQQEFEQLQQKRLTF